MLFVGPGVGRPVDPLPPEVLGLAQEAAAGLNLGEADAAGGELVAGQSKRHRVARVYCELLAQRRDGDRAREAVVVAVNRVVGVGAPGLHDQRVGLTPVVGPRVERLPEPDRPCQAGDDAHDAGVPVRPCVLGDVMGIHGHQVRDDGHAPARSEDGAEDVALVGVALPRVERLRGGDLPGAPALVVQDARQEARAVEARQAAPVDAAVGADQRQRAAVADDAVVGQWQVAVVASPQRLERELVEVERLRCGHAKSTLSRSALPRSE